MTRDEAREFIAQSVRGDVDMAKVADALKALEQQTCEDAVSRQATIEAIANTNVNGESLGYAVAYDILCDLPSVNPQPICENAISRQSAILLASDLKQDLPDDEHIADMVMAHNEGVLEYQTQLSLLPSINPQQRVGHWIFKKTVFDKFGNTVECSSCHKKWKTYDEIRWRKENKFCHDCGAKMVEPQESEVSE